MCRALFSGYLSQVVKAQSGRTAMQWLETFTIWQAGHLLRNSPGMSIKEVAYALRFPDQPGCSGVISGARRGQLALGLPRGGFRRAQGGGMPPRPWPEKARPRAAGAKKSLPPQALWPEEQVSFLMGFAGRTGARFT